MSRYRQATVGVFDTTTGLAVIPGMASWATYRQWLEDGNTPDPALPPPAPDPAFVRRESIAKVNQVREARLQSLTVTLGTFTFDADRESREQLLQTVTMLQAGDTLPAGFTWRSSDNQDIPATPAQLVTLGKKMRAAVQAVMAYSWQLKGQLAAAADPSTIDITQGWPS